MKTKKSLLIIIISLCINLSIHAQESRTDKISGTVLPAVIENGDTIPLVYLKEVIIFPQRFTTRKQQQQYDKLVRDVKITLPYAKMVYHTLIETYEYIETLPTEKDKEQHLKRMEKELYQEYKPKLKKLTLTQGKLLIKLIDRECNQSSYNLLKTFLGSFRAGFWNIFASMLGANLKSEYDPSGKDAMTERVVVMVEKGLI
ncbi:MAG: DUF4294 domain-containing protein [Tannerellaceae bacterium]|jgi:hypothetical protein|nr:DUF4294 domain-containing protein [Tannerellaceae bacterium]